MAISQALCTSFKQQLFEATHDFNVGGDVFKIALYTSSATIGAGTTAYTTTDEVVGVGYTAGGNTLTNVGTFASGTTAFIDFDNTTWANATITAAGAMIYNTTPSTGSYTNPAVAVFNFGGNKVSTDGDFSIIFPTADAYNAVIRID